MEIEFWHWLALGTILLILEVLSGTMLLLWPALAALAVGAIVAAEPMAWYSQVVLFSMMTVASTVTGRYWWKRRASSDRPNLNRRGNELVGRRIELANGLARGRGRALVDGVWWQVAVADRAEAAHSAGEASDAVAVEVVVVGVEGATLLVAPRGEPPMTA